MNTVNECVNCHSVPFFFARLAHNSLRDTLCARLSAAGLVVEKEQSGLLPHDPRRRPGDLFLPQWPGGVPLALDFAVTSPLKLLGLRDAAQRSLASAAEYEDKKLNDRQTAQRCAAEGLKLVPMVVESLGGWGNRHKRFSAHWLTLRQLAMAPASVWRPTSCTRS